MKVKMLKSSMAGGVYLPAGEVVEVRTKDARVLIAYKKAVSATQEDADIADPVSVDATRVADEIAPEDTEDPEDPEDPEE